MLPCPIGEFLGRGYHGRIVSDFCKRLVSDVTKRLNFGMKSSLIVAGAFLLFVF